jgi:hypothetical protein
LLAEYPPIPLKKMAHSAERKGYGKCRRLETTAALQAILGKRNG